MIKKITITILISAFLLNVAAQPCYAQMYTGDRFEPASSVIPSYREPDQFQPLSSFQKRAPFDELLNCQDEVKPAGEKRLPGPAKLEDARAEQPKLPEGLLPPGIFAHPKEKQEKIKDLTGFQLVSDSNSKLEVVIFQVGDYIGLETAPQIASQLREDVKLLVISGNDFITQKTLNSFRNKGIKNLDQRLRFITVNGISSWGRDPYIVVVNPQTRKSTLIPARLECPSMTASPTSCRKIFLSPDLIFTDRSVASEIMKYDINEGIVVNNEFYALNIQQGGDITSDDTFVYVGQGTAIDKVAGKRAILLKDMAIEDPHNDRYHIPVGKTKYGEHTSLLTDPVRLMEIISSLTPTEKEEAIDNILKAIKETYLEKVGSITREKLTAFFDVEPETIENVKRSNFVQKLEALKAALEVEGIAVQRIPGLPDGFANNTFGIYPTNVIMDYYIDEVTKEAQRSVIVPHYGIPKLDSSIDKTYIDLGFKVLPVKAIVAGSGKGGPRCTVQVIGFPISRE